MVNKKLAGDVEEVKEVKEEKAEVKKAEKLSDFLEAYKKQNPVKFEAKMARGELKGL